MSLGVPVRTVQPVSDATLTRLRTRAAAAPIAPSRWISNTGSQQTASLTPPQLSHALRLRPAGNPVSSFVCFSLVVLPCLRKMMGLPQPELRRLHATLTSDIKLDHERPEYHRATLQYGPVPGAQDGAVGWYAVSTGNQISSRILSARSANALLEIPRASGVLPAGSKVSALLIGDLREMPVPQQVPVTEGF